MKCVLCVLQRPHNCRKCLRKLILNLTLTTEHILMRKIQKTLYIVMIYNSTMPLYSSEEHAHPFESASFQCFSSLFYHT